jgi:hypothetical protein
MDAQAADDPEGRRDDRRAQGEEGHGAPHCHGQKDAGACGHRQKDDSGEGTGRQENDRYPRRARGEEGDDGPEEAVEPGIAVSRDERPTAIFVDYDGTITDVDTFDVLVRSVAGDETWQRFEDELA